MAALFESGLRDFELSEYHLWFLVDASGALSVVAVDTVEWVEAALEVVLEDELEELLNILGIFDACACFWKISRDCLGNLVGSLRMEV